MVGDIFSFAIFSWLIQIIVFLYLLWLATRFVQAVERIAERMDRRMN